MKNFFLLTLILNTGMLFCTSEEPSGKYTVNIYEKDKVVRIQISLTDSESAYDMTCLNKYNAEEAIPLASFLNSKNKESEQLLSSMICELKVKNADNKEEIKFKASCDINKLVDQVIKMQSINEDAKEEMKKSKSDLIEIFKNFINEEFKQENLN